MHARTRFGRSGEALAEELYRRNGFTIVERNARVGRGEIDLIVRRGRLIVFCEVKTRGTERWGEPAEAVGYVKQQQVRRLAAQWLRQRGASAAEVRFDVVSVIVRGRRPEIKHIPNAF